MIKPVRKVRKLEAVSNCGSSCPGKRQSGGKARSSFPALSGSAGTTGRITGRRGGRHEDFLSLVILAAPVTGRELDSIEPDSGVVR